MDLRTVLCFGDSNTHGTMPLRDFGGAGGRYDRRTRWPRVMAAALGQGWEVIEEGHPGRTTVHPDPYDGAWRNGAAVLPALLESHRPLDAVVIMLGTNDMKSMFGMGPQDIAHSLGALVRIVQQNGCGPEGGCPAVLLICPPAPIETGLFSQMFRGAAEKGRALPAEVAVVAQRMGVRWFDANRVMRPDPGEGIHFTPEGHRALGAAVASEVRALFT